MINNMYCSDCWIKKYPRFDTKKLMLARIKKTCSACKRDAFVIENININNSVWDLLKRLLKIRK